ncbi:MAG: hypothetical protein LBM25_00940 [Bacteroidales bacterium]|jgi:hypothetical protein|nr:hypothetical protein [Bacteroidales bacterium]
MKKCITTILLTYSTLFCYSQIIDNASYNRIRQIDLIKGGYDLLDLTIISISPMEFEKYKFNGKENKCITIYNDSLIKIIATEINKCEKCDDKYYDGTIDTRGRLDLIFDERIISIYISNGRLKIANNCYYMTKELRNILIYLYDNTPYYEYDSHHRMRRNDSLIDYNLTFMYFKNNKTKKIVNKNPLIDTTFFYKGEILDNVKLNH